MATPKALSIEGTKILDIETSRTAVLDSKGTARFADGTAWPRSEVVSKWRASKLGIAPEHRNRRRSAAPKGTEPPRPDEAGIICGRVRLTDAMSAMSWDRPIFHSEADFQFSLGQSIVRLDNKIAVRLERPVRVEDRSIYLDLHCSYEDAQTAIELKYFTRGWRGPVRGEYFELRDHAARDLARRHFLTTSREWKLSPAMATATVLR